MNKISIVILLSIGLPSIFTSCKKSGEVSTPAATTGTVTTTGTTTTTTTTKSPIIGLVAQGSAKPTDSTWVPDNTFAEINVHPEVYVATVIRVEWKQLEPQQNAFNFSAIDSALSNIKKYNTAHPLKPVTGKLRIFCGVNVPAWVKALAGGPVSATDPNTGIQVSVGRFWTSAYRQAWQDLQTALAAKYDNNTLLQEVAVSSCSTLTAEPFIQPFNATTIPVLHAAGFTDALFKAALNGALDDYAAWKITPIDYTFNIFRPTYTGVPTTDSTFAPSLMQTFRIRYGGRAVLANHGLQSPNDASSSTIYATFLTLGKPIEFQTVSPTVDWNATIALGLSYKPTEIEIWDTKAAGGSANLTLAQLQLWASQIGK